MYLLATLSALLLSGSASAQQYWTTHSPLTAFKQLGFENHYNGNQQSAYIPYSISDFAENSANAETRGSAAAPSSGFQQIRHPNDILSNMGVDLPSEEILGRNHYFVLYLVSIFPCRAYEVMEKWTQGTSFVFKNSKGVLSDHILWQ